MHTLDEIDVEILSLLGEDARRPFSDIAETVGLSGPAVSDRVARLEDAGVINRFTIDVDRSTIQGGVPVFVQVDVGGASADVDSLRERIGDADAVEHLFVTAEGDIWFYARAEGRNVRRWLEELLGNGDLEYRVTLMDDVEWRPSLGGTAFALTCAECGNTVDSEGESATIGGDAYHFCCPSCRERFENRYARLEEGA
ncbi:AsnC family transcriptional regulator [Saliphagus sp. GCM10025317]